MIPEPKQCMDTDDLVLQAGKLPKNGIELSRSLD